ncbi:sulfatase-like hydrolase/transferase [uncultured Mitsuokella sp.]|uniref:sulfatase-like hydrolase/transferase n=1 Tax=uncultured Mitsuokella sp. TaxID=453120 RepID=UPI002628641D|nr:sulfatase-like hydrolase/transferase [uncultured Mitsuokella sp.]
MEYKAGYTEEERERIRLFHLLMEKLEAGAFDDAYLALLARFWKRDADDAEGEILYARYALAQGGVSVAAEYAKKAFRHRKVNLVLWEVLRDVYKAERDFPMAMLFMGFLSDLYGMPIQLDVPRRELNDSLEFLSLGMSQGNYAPVARHRMEMTEEGLSDQKKSYIGTFLPTMYQREKQRYWVGAYVEAASFLDGRGMLLKHIAAHERLVEDADLPFDLMKAAELPAGEEHRVEVPEGGAILPVAGTELGQEFRFHELQTGKAGGNDLGLYAFQFYRLKEATNISSDQTMVCGAPIPLGHSPKRRKVVLSLFLDAFCWRAIKDETYALVPNILRFFEQGVIFDDHHSVSEYTYPSVPSIETGLYPHHTQIYSERESYAINPDVQTLSREMKKLGYYCTILLGAGDSVWTEVLDGHDRILANPYGLRVHDGVARAISQLEAFHEVDQFLVVHTMDLHPWGPRTKGQLPLSAQTSLPIAERNTVGEGKVTSVYLPKNERYAAWTREAARETDRALGWLFDYIAEHYEEDEFLVMLYSDHGLPIYEKNHYLLSDYQTGAAFMLRGGGVPSLGRVEEMTSTVDIFPTLGSLLGFPVRVVDGCVPKVLGGEERGYAISMSLYPGIPFFCAIRTKAYEWRLKSLEITDEDGRADLRGAKRVVYRRGTEKETKDANVIQFFDGIAKAFLDTIDSHGLQWPDMRKARPAWYEERKPGDADKI